MHLDTALVRELELASAITAKHCVVAAKAKHPEYEYLEWCGGIAAFTGIGSPITQVIGAGIGVAVAAADLDQLQAFYFDRGADLAIELAPYIDPSFLELLKARPYRLEEFSNVLLRPINPSDLQYARPVGFSVQRASEQDMDLFTRTVAEGYAEEIAITDDLLDVVRGFASLPNSASYIAFVDGEPAGGGSAAYHGNIGGLFGASTLPRFRRRGIQTALMRVRLQWLAQQGCTMAHIITHPGTTSQRNMERAGFQSTYTRTKVVRVKP